MLAGVDDYVALPARFALPLNRSLTPAEEVELLDSFDPKNFNFGAGGDDLNAEACYLVVQEWTGRVGDHALGAAVSASPRSASANGTSPYRGP